MLACVIKHSSHAIQLNGNWSIHRAINSSAIPYQPSGKAK